MDLLFLERISTSSSWLTLYLPLIMCRNFTLLEPSDVSFECSPTIEQQYRSFKTIQISDCQFVSKYKATPKSLSHWLGESIHELPQSAAPEPDVCFFKVGDNSGPRGGPSRKRKHSELESEYTPH